MSPFPLEFFLENLTETYRFAGGQIQAVFYALALLLLGFLALPRRARGPVISGALCLLWVWMGIGFIQERPAWASVRTWLGLLVLVQSALFLWSGVIRGRTLFVPRADIGPIAGALVLAYALAVFPLLGGALGLPESSWISLPFPGLLFSLGLLLFLAAPVPRHLLAIPLAWAAIGGDGLLAEVNPGSLVNLAAFATGFYLLVPPRQEQRNEQGDVHIEGYYERARRHRQWHGRFLWGLLLASSLFIYLALEGPLPLKFLFEHLGASSIIVLMLGGALWLAMPAWYSLGFRYLAWASVRTLRAAYDCATWLMARWERVLFVLAALALIVWKTGLHVVARNRWDESVEFLVWGVVLLFLVYSVYRGRRSLVILPFSVDTTESMGKEKEAEADRRGRSLASGLRNELVSIADLYKTIDEALPAKSGKVTESSMVVEDVGDAILDTIGPDSMIKIRGLEIPIGLLFRAVGRIVHGPRLTGSLQKEGNHLLLMAELSGGRWGAASWKIREEAVHESSDGAGEITRDETLIAQRMIEQLACRVIARIGEVGSPRWEAVQHFHEGLKAYRGTRLAGKDVCPALRKAERELIQALREDGSFTLCHYDLGVIYEKLEEAESAEACFRRCLAEDPAWSAAYYSLAESYLAKDDFTRASIYARKVLETDPGDARAWNLRGVARERGHRNRSPHGPFPPSVEWDFEIATALAWRSLCCAALKKPAVPPRRELELAGLCTTNLGIVQMVGTEERSNGYGPRESCQIARQALHLSPQEPWYHLILGEALLLSGKPKEAQAELYRAFGDSLEPEEHAERWAYQLAAASQLAASENGPEEARREIVRAFRNFLDVAVPPEGVILSTGAQARNKIHLRWYANRLNACERTLDSIQGLVLGAGATYLRSLRNCLILLRRLDVGPVERAELPTQLAPTSEEERLWRRAQKMIRAGRISVDRNPSWALTCVREALQILEDLGEKSWPSRQIVRQGLRGLLAKACLSEWHRTKDKRLLREALAAADQAVAERPESAARRWIRGEVYCALEDFEQAAGERATAIELASILEMLHGPEEISHVARRYLEPAPMHGTKQAGERSNQARDFFQRLLEQIESKSLARDAMESELQLQIHACVHYWLGIFHELLGDRTLAAYHLRISHAMDYEPIDTALRLGKIYAEAGLPRDAEKAFLEVVQVGREHPEVSPEQAAEGYFGLVDVLVKQGHRSAEARQFLLAVLALKTKLKEKWLMEELEERFCSVASGVFGSDRKVMSMTERLQREARVSPSAETYHQLAEIYEEALRAA